MNTNKSSSNSPPSSNGNSYPNNYIQNQQYFSPQPTSSYNANRYPNHYNNQRPPQWNNNMYQQQFYPQQHQNYPPIGYYPPQNNFQQFNPNFGPPQGMMYQNSNNRFNPNYNKGNMNQNFNKNKNNKNNKHGPPQNNNNKNNNNNNKKQKTDDTKSSPETQKCQFYCELCDREFKTDDKYKEHCATHTKCHVEGCKYIAAEKLVKIHFQNFHASGMDKKIPKLETPEEIEKYRSERRKNFPSNINIQTKTKLEAEINKTGAVLETKQFGRLKNKKRQFDENKNPSEILSEPSSKSQKGDLSEKEDGETSDKSLSPITNNKNLANKIKNKKNRNKNKNKRVDQRHLTRKPTLLQQLLADEIRHERNILLQCVRYVIRKNFFDKTSGPTSSKNVLDVQNIEEQNSESKLLESVTETDESSDVTASDETSDCSLKTEDQLTESEATTSDKSGTCEALNNSETCVEISKKF